MKREKPRGIAEDRARGFCPDKAACHASSAFASPAIRFHESDSRRGENTPMPAKGRMRRLTKRLFNRISIALHIFIRGVFNRVFHF